MRLFIIPAVLAAALAGAASLTPASAAGCIKGAVVGGIAGHFAGHHGLLGAGAGCVVGHTMANRRMDERDRAYEPGEGYNPPVEGYQRPGYLHP